MKKGDREKAMWLLRAAADLLEADSNEHILPGWDKESEGLAVLGGENHRTRCEDIRAGAKAVLAEGLSCNECTHTPIRQLGALARYIGDMLEE